MFFQCLEQRLLLPLSFPLLPSSLFSLIQKATALYPT